MDHEPTASTPTLSYESRSHLKPKNTAAAISFLFGLTLFLPLLAGIPAIVYGRRGLRAARQEALGRVRMARAGIGLGMINLTIAAILLMAAPFVIIEARQKSLQADCRAHLRLIMQALALYSNQNKGIMPPTLDTLVSTGFIPAGDARFNCPACVHNASKLPVTVGALVRSDYAYPSPPWRCPPNRVRFLGATPSGIVDAWEPLSNHQGRGMHVIYRDCEIEWLEGAKAVKVIAELQAGLNPPPTLNSSAAEWWAQPATTRATTVPVR